MTTISIPTPAELATSLGGLERLLQAKKWERAAIVWAFTIEKSAGRPPLAGPHRPRPLKIIAEVVQFPCGVREFARLGFAGLGSVNTVRFYRDQWERAIGEGKAQPVEPGQADVELPDLEWSLSPRTQSRRYQLYADDMIAAAEEAGISSGTVLDVSSNKAAVLTAIKADPELARAIAQDRDAERSVTEAAIQIRKDRLFDPNTSADDFDRNMDEMVRNGDFDRVIDETIPKVTDTRQAVSHAHTALERAVSHTQHARHLMRGIPVTQNVKDRLSGLVGRLAATTDELQALMSQESEFDAKLMSILLGEED